MNKLKEFSQKHKIITGGIVTLAIIIIIASLSSGNDVKKDGVATSSQASPDQAAAVQQPTQPKTWQKVISMATDANKQSETFKLEGGQQKLIYKTTGNSIMCAIYLLGETETLEKDGGFPVVTLTDAKSGETLMRKSAGNYYLDVKNSLGKCDVEVQELR